MLCAWVGLPASATSEAENRRTADALARAVVRAADTPADGQRRLLPPGTTVVGVDRVDGVLHIDLAVDAVSWEVTPMQMEAISAALSAPFWQDPDFRGVVIRARTGSDPAFLPLESFVPLGAPPMPNARPMGEPAAPAADRRAAASAHGTRPAGALSGVVVYTTAGHGWTAGDSIWYLQRPLLLDMVEDYGNIDQLNYFVEYLHLAGATVVPFRPVGYQDIEIVLDQDDPEVTYIGTWTNSTFSVHYENGRTSSGVSYTFADVSPTETATARYTPNLPEAGFYPVYTWVTDSDNRAVQMYRIVHTGGTTEVTVDHRMVGRGWVWLGNYYFDVGAAGYVEISNQSTEGSVIIADAIRFGNGMGDVVGAGPGTISSYAREEEGQRYWAESETSINANGLFSSIFDCCSSDASDNVGTGARWAAAMNNQSVNNDRWRRAYVEFHSNAAGCGSPTCGAKGTVALVNSANPTTNQATFAQIMGDEIESDMQILDDQFEFPWGSRSNPIYGAYGAISSNNNGNEFDATLLEVAFHDNVEDTANLLNPAVRDAVARSTVHAVVKFLHGLAGSTIPEAFLPLPPQNVRALQEGSGDVVVSWQAPPAGEAYGDPATGYRIHRSSNGYGFDDGQDVGDVLTVTLTDIPADTITYLRVSAYNTGGSSRPSEVLAVRVPAAGDSGILIVNGFDRVSRAQDPTQTIPAGTMRRPIQRRVNSFDYVVQHAEALEQATTNGFDACANEAVMDNLVMLDDYEVVIWILGEESTADATFNPTEQTRVSDYLTDGGGLFVSGAEIGWDLDAQNNGRAFYEQTLASDYLTDDAGTYSVVASGGGIFDGLAPFAFGPASAAPYDVDTPDSIAAGPGGQPALAYSGGFGGTAAVQYDHNFHSRVVNFAFPFETITSEAVRADVMTRIFDYLSDRSAPLPFDHDNDGDVDLSDYGVFAFCLQGPAVTYLPTHFCAAEDSDEDGDVDLDDFALFQFVFTGSR
jgi:hypothetical protein